MDDKTHRSYRGESRRDWGTSGQITDETIKLGALLRIADATELMARRYQELVNENANLKRRAEYAESHANVLGNRLRAAKGAITKLRKRLAGAA